MAGARGGCHPMPRPHRHGRPCAGHLCRTGGDTDGRHRAWRVSAGRAGGTAAPSMRMSCRRYRVSAGGAGGVRCFRYGLRGESAGGFRGEPRRRSVVCRHAALPRDPWLLRGSPRNPPWILRVNINRRPPANTDLGSSPPARLTRVRSCDTPSGSLAAAEIRSCIRSCMLPRVVASVGGGNPILQGSWLAIYAAPVVIQMAGTGPAMTGGGIG